MVQVAESLPFRATMIERDYQGNPIGQSNMPTPPPTPEPRPKGWAWGYYGGEKPKGFGDLKGALKDTYRRPEDFYNALATYDPANPTIPTPAGSSLSTYLSSNPDMQNWLLNYTQNYYAGTRSGSNLPFRAGVQRDYQGNLL